MFSTVRAVYASENYQLTNSVFNNFYGKENGKFLTMGEILTRSKNSNSSPGILQNSRKFLLFGDPAQTLAYPILENEVLSINDRPLGLDTIRALQTVELKAGLNYRMDKLQPISTGFYTLQYLTSLLI